MGRGVARRFTPWAGGIARWADDSAGDFTPLASDLADGVMPRAALRGQASRCRRGPAVGLVTDVHGAATEG